ncbi:MAG: T9SS type A sorting domain-containing protein [Bacteroidota bacterium]
MYLHKPFHPDTFVPEPNSNKLVNKVKHIVFTTLTFCLLTVYSAMGQNEIVWPGEISQNAKVSNIDVLYLGWAFESVGPDRGGVPEVWSPQSGEAWDDTFPDGTNLIHADCNGDGIVNESDLEVIDFQYNQISGTPGDDGIVSGDPALHPSLELDLNTLTITDANTFEIDLLLGSEQQTVEQFLGIAFSISFDNFEANGTIQSVDLNVHPESWIADGDNPLTFVKREGASNTYDAVIVRTSQEDIGGDGPIGRFSIVMEEIIFGISSGNIVIDNIRMIDESFVTHPVASTVLKLGLVSTTSVVEPSEWEEWLTIYPNPVRDHFFVKELNPKAKWTSLEVYQANGKRVYQTTQYNPMKQVELLNQPPGSYYLRLTTESGFIIHDFIKY